MTAETQDRELVGAYAREGSDAAFHALVRRHVDLVYATAFRQIGDRGFAEEITQNVFVALARKAPRLAELETLAGWLHRTAVLEAKARIRSELRRRERESAAGQLAELRSEGTPALEALVPLLDEALLHLRETDRLALIVRFMEDRPLREVGEVLGVDEDAARKRVSRALERVTDFFRARGFALPGGATAGATALLAQGVQAAPAGLAATSAAAGLAAGGAATGASALVLSLMTLTKTQTALICAVLAGVPLAWQWQVRSDADRNFTSLGDALAAERVALNRANDESDRLRTAFFRAEAETLTTRSRVAVLAAERKPGPAKAYQWDDNSPLVRVPKEMLKRLPLATVRDKRGHLTPQMTEALQLTPDEASGIQAALDRFVAGVHAEEASVVRRVEPTDQDLDGHRPDEVRVFEFPDLKREVAALRTELLLDLNQLLDGPRAEMLIQGLKDWMPLDEEDHGVNSFMAVFNRAHRVRYYNVSRFNEGELSFDWGYAAANSSMSTTIAAREIPEYLRPALQDWIDDAHRAHAEELRAAASAPAKP